MAAERSLPSRPVTWIERIRVQVRNPARAAVWTLAVLMIVSIGVRVWLSREIASPWIMNDEFRYSELAKSFAATGHFLIRESRTSIGNVGYPALISPAWWLHPMSTTYQAAKGINVVLATATVVPLFLWARRLVSPFHSVVAVVLTLLMPSLIYTGMLMTENAFLPAFVLAAFVLARALERPTVLWQAFAFGTIGLAAFIRFQGLVLVAVVPTAILLKVLFELRAEPRKPWTRFVAAELRRYWFSAGLLIVGAVLYVGYELARGRSLKSGLGSYEVVAHGGYSFGLVRHWVFLHFAELPLFVGVLPASAFLLLVLLAFRRGGTRSEAERAFLAVTVAAIPWIVVEVAAFASRFSIRIEERYMFFLSPFLFLALALWLDRGLPRPRVMTVVAGVVPALLFLALPLGTLLNISIYSDTFELIPFLRLSQVVHGITWTERILVAGGILAALVFIFWPRRWHPSLVLPGAVAAFLVLSTYTITGALRDYSRSTRDLAGTSGSPSWIDRALGPGRQAGFLLGTTGNPWPETLGLWQLEFWNRRLGPIYNLGIPDPAGGSETPVQVSPTTGEIVSELTGEPVQVPYAVSGLSARLGGRLIAVHPPFALYRTAGPLRLAEKEVGVYPDRWMGADASYTRFVRRAPGRLIVALSRKVWSGPDKPVRARLQLVPLGGPHAGQPIITRRVTLAGHGSRSLGIATPGGPFTVTVHIDPTYSPSQFGYADTRQLGAQVVFSPR
jgi:hypothetical protein